MDPAMSIDGESPGGIEPSGNVLAGPAPAAERFAFRGKLLHSAILAVFYDVEDAFLVECEVVGIGHLTWLATTAAPTTNKFAVAAEHLDAMITRVGRIEQAVGTQ